MIRLKMTREVEEVYIRRVKERRRHVRARRVMSVQHRLYKRRGRAVKGEWLTSLTENMSVGGLLFVSPVMYQPGDVLEIRVVMSGILDLFIGFGKVIRTSPTRNRKTFYTALKYVFAGRTRRWVKSRF